MERTEYDKATVALHKIEKLKAIKAKLNREFLEFEFDPEAKEIGNQIFNLIDKELKVWQDEFGNL